MTDINIKDYLHLYLGCEVVSTGGASMGQLVGVGLTQATVCPTDKFEPRTTLVEYLKPVLRPLSDITEEECIKANSLSGDGAFNEDEDLKLYYTRKAVFFEPEEFRYLLSIGIDLFGLISAGLAVDKTTLK